ncbi:MAG: hypothetical protein V3R48_06340, partial [Thermoplasmata archaeon]
PLGTLESSAAALQMEGADVETDLRWSTIQYHLGDAGSPVLSLLAFDTLEAVYGPEVASRLTGHLAAIRKSKDVFVGLASADSPSAEALANLASVHLRIENVEGSILLYGEKPYTSFHSISYDVERGFPQARLLPVV